MRFFQIVYEVFSGLFEQLNLAVVLAIIVVMLVLRWRKVGMLTWALAWVIGCYLGFRFGFATPVPSSVITLYMAIVIGSVLAYVSSSRERWQSFFSPILHVVLQPRYRGLLVIIMLGLPALAAANVWMRMNVPLEAPAFGRTIHPAPPVKITVHDEEIDLVSGGNPFRPLEESDPEAFRQHVENGRRVYYENCFYCHGDRLAGDGMFAHGLNPIPTNFTDQGVLPMFQETFFFWRISKGGPGLPEEGGPWDSAMPRWEQFLSNDEIWDVILFLYDFTGYRPRAHGGEGE